MIIRAWKTEEIIFDSFADYYIQTRSYQDDAPTRAAIAEELAAEPKDLNEVRAMEQFLDKTWAACPGQLWQKRPCNCQWNHL